MQKRSCWIGSNSDPNPLQAGRVLTPHVGVVAGMVLRHTRDVAFAPEEKGYREPIRPRASHPKGGARVASRFAAAMIGYA